MQKLMRYVTTAGMAALVSAASPVWAESAPVFDVDSFESAGAESGQDLPMPPPPGEETAATHAMPSSGASGVADPAPATTFVQTGPAAVGAGAGAGAIDGSEPAQPTVAGTSAGASVSTADLSPEERMRRLEAQLNALKNSESAQHVESLQSEVQSLRGQIEVLNHQIDKMQAQQKATGTSTASVSPDTDDVTAKTTPGLGVVTTEAAAPVSKKTAAKKVPVAAEKTTETKTSDVKPADTKTTASSVTKDQPDVAEEQKIYQTAYDFIKAKKYNDAVDALQDMLKKYPSGQFASNAHYWLGELYGLLGKNDKAFDEFSLVINKFPGSPRVSDAQLKLGIILAAQSKWTDAKRALKQVINTYPGTASARLASEQLKQIKTAGH